MCNIDSSPENTKYRLLKTMCSQMGQCWKKEQKWCMQSMQWEEWKLYGEKTAEISGQTGGWGMGGSWVNQPTSSPPSMAAQGCAWAKTLLTTRWNLLPPLFYTGIRWWWWRIIRWLQSLHWLCTCSMGWRLSFASVVNLNSKCIINTKCLRFCSETCVVSFLTLFFLYVLFCVKYLWIL